MQNLATVQASNDSLRREQVQLKASNDELSRAVNDLQARLEDFDGLEEEAGVYIFHKTISQKSYLILDQEFI